MLIHPVEPAPGYNPKRHAAPGAMLVPEVEALPDGIIHARVEAILTDGHVRISAAGRTLLFIPPRPLDTGDHIDLVVVARKPRLVMELVDGAPGNNPAPEISRVATLIGRLSASGTPPGTPPGTPRPGVITTAAQPLLTAPPTHPLQIASQLAQIISGSGLFYEAHQAEWVAGTRTWTQLVAEPQARLPQPAPVGNTTPRPAAEAAPQTTAQQPHTHPDALPLVRAQRLPASAGDATPLLLPAAEAGLQTTARQLHTHPDALPLVRAQLDALDSRRLFWQGELWPGQPAEWEIRGRDEDASPETAAADHASGTWQTQLRLVLPRLGPVTATLEAHGTTIGIRIHAAVTDSAETLGAERSALRTALTAAGITVRELIVAQASPAPRAAPAHTTEESAQ